MPRSAASLGPWTFTGLPSKVYSPSSKAWMPAMPLIRVLLPAPLSPTRAVTGPGRTSRSTPRSTCTAPKLFWMPRRLSSGSSDAITGACSVAGTDTGISSAGGMGGPGGRPWAARVWKRGSGARPGRNGPPSWRLALLDAVLLAGLLELVDTDVGCLLEAVVDDRLHLVRGDPHRDGQRGRDVLAGLGVLDGAGRQGGGRVGVTVDQGDGEVRGRLGLEVGVLVDRAALVAGEHVLQTLDRSVLTSGRDLSGRAVVLHAGDDAAGHRVVGGHDAVDLALVLGVQLLVGVAGLRRVPESALVTDELVVARVDLRLEGLFVALLEQRGVVVVRVAVDVDDVGLGLAGRVQAVGETGAHQAADRDVVERHVVRRAATQGQAVVVDALHAGVGGLAQARLAGLGVQVDDHDDRDALVDHAVADLAELGDIATGVVDDRLDAGCVERRLQARAVIGLPARGGRLVGQDHADLALGVGGRAAAAAVAAAVAVAPASCEGTERERAYCHQGRDARSLVPDHFLDLHGSDHRDQRHVTAVTV